MQEDVRGAARAVRASATLQAAGVSQTIEMMHAILIVWVLLGSLSWGIGSCDRLRIAVPFSYLGFQAKPSSPGPGGAQDKAAETYVNLTIRLSGGGKIQLLKATEVSGKLVEREGPSSDYVYEITKQGVPQAVGFLPQGGFSLRGFKDPRGDDGEKVASSTSTTVTLSVPHTSLGSVLEGAIGLKIYKIAQGIELETVSFDVIRKLVAKKKVSVEFELSGGILGNQAKELNSGSTNSPR